MHGSLFSVFVIGNGVKPGVAFILLFLEKRKWDENSGGFSMILLEFSTAFLESVKISVCLLYDRGTAGTCLFSDTLIRNPDKNHNIMEGFFRHPASFFWPGDSPPASSSLYGKKVLHHVIRDFYQGLVSNTLSLKRNKAGLKFQTGLVPFCLFIQPRAAAAGRVSCWRTGKRCRRPG